MQILVSIGVVGAFSPNRRNVTTLWLFFDCPYLFSRSCDQVEPLDRFSRFMAQTTCFRPRMVLLGLERWVAIFGGICPQNPPKMGMNRQFQAKTAKYKNRNISKTINRIKTKFEDRADTDNCTLWVVQHYPHQIQYGCRSPSWKNRYDVITPPMIIRLLRNLAGRCKMACQWLYIDRNRNRK